MTPAADLSSVGRVVHQLSRRQARRIAVRAQLLDAPRPTDLLQVLNRLDVVQADQTAAVAPNADLVCWSRLGADYRAGDLERLRSTGAVVEFSMLLRPASVAPLLRAEMADWPGQPERPWHADLREWVAANDECRREILEVLRGDGPLPAGDLPDSCAVPWRSSGWNNNRDRMRLLEIMEQRGEIAVAERQGRERLWDLAERVYPDDPDGSASSALSVEGAERRRGEIRLRALGLARGRATQTPNEPNHVGEVGEEAVIDGVRGTWRVDPAQLAAVDEPFRGRAALLSPLDRLVYDRKRMAEIFEFDYQLEMYKPAARRRWGYFALPVLYGDRLVGKLDATSDRDAGVLRVHALHRDVEFSAAMDRAIGAEIRSLARWLGLVPVDEPTATA